MVARLSLLGVVVLSLIGCAKGDGPNDPGMTSDQIKKVRAAAVKPSDGNGPDAGPKDANHPNKR